MVGFVPKEMFFTKGVGKHREKLTSFELALRSAGIAACNLVRVSSIFPPKCRILSRSKGLKRLEPGPGLIGPILREQQILVHWLPVAGDNPDVDTPADLERLTGEGSA